MSKNPFETAQLKAIEEHIRSIMDILDIPVTKGNERTPYRIAKMYTQELFKNRGFNNIEELDNEMRVFINECSPSYSGPVVVRDIPFSSTCEHHWLPFFGTVSITYTPSESILGLSKFARVVNYLSKKPQLQERLTNEIGDYLWDLLQPKYLKIEVSATHTCVLCRGVEKESVTDTSYERSSSIYQ